MPEFKCEQCGKIFEQETSLKQHFNDKHVQRPAEQPTHTEQHAHEIPHHEHKPEQETQKVKIKVGKSAIYAIIAIVVIGAGGYGAYAYLSSAPSGADTASSLSAPMGPLGSTHIHADFAVFLDGDEITPLEPRYFVRNQFVHVEEGAGAGSVIHMHATNVPLNIFFRSLGMSFNSECFRLDNGKEYCNEGNNTLKMFVKRDGGEWEENRKFHTYIFEDLDKILVTYGDETDEEIERQQDSVTDFSAANSERFGR